ncbi:MAG: CpaF family protein [Lachnospiraceae bacterium]|nr:CpaF family protein [Lachnospiraceae bacterium]
MTDYFSKEVEEIRKKVREDPSYAQMTQEQLRDRIEKMLEQRIAKVRQEDPATTDYYSSLTFRERHNLLNGVYESIKGMGILGKIMKDKSITEIMINGYDNIFVERNGELERLQERFESKEQFRNIIMTFAEDAGRPVTQSDPIVDTRLEDGSRVNIVLDPIALDGPVVTIRRFPEEGMTIQKLIQYGSLTPEAAVFLEKLVRAKYNIFISGGTGSGKTTFLNALSNFIPPKERVITIEDSAELQIRHIPNLVRLETKNANSAGVGGISMRDLIKSSLRMRPERIVVGEVRGAEALDMLQAMNTGHDGSISTGHANTAEDMISRLETMVLSGSPGLPLQAIRQQIYSAVDVIIHLSRMRDGTRKTMSINEVSSIDERGNIQLNPIFAFEEDRQKGSSRRVVGSLKRTGNPMEHSEKFYNNGIYDFLEEGKSNG